MKKKHNILTLKRQFVYIALLSVCLFAIYCLHGFSNSAEKPVVVQQREELNAITSALASLAANNQTPALPSSSRCVDAWPEDVQLFLPLPPTEFGLYEFSALLLQSMALFWPVTTSKLLIVTDSEAGSNQLELFRRDIEQRCRGVVAQLNITDRPAPFSMEGWDRQQWLMFWADNFTRSEFIGFLDSDSVFVTRLTRDDFFDEQRRPIIRALYSKYRDNWWGDVTVNTLWATGKKEPFHCMSYFPVIIRREHLDLFRKHVIKQVKAASMLEVFEKLADKRYGQFNLFCTYLWYYQRQHYNWVVAETNFTSTEYSIETSQISERKEANISDDYFKHPLPRLVIHWNYEIFKDTPGALRAVLAAGVCYSLNNHGDDHFFDGTYCEGVNRSEPNIFEWIFEDRNYLHQPGVKEAHLKRLERIDKLCPHPWRVEAVKAVSKIPDFKPPTRSQSYIYLALAIIAFFVTVLTSLLTRRQHDFTWPCLGVLFIISTVLLVQMSFDIF